MGLLDNVERGLERIVGGAFAKTFKSGVQPIEVVAALKREMDTRAVIVSRDRILAPHTYSVGLHPSDHARLSAHGPALVSELVAAVRDYANRQRYAFAGPVTVALAAQAGITEGVITVTSVASDPSTGWQAAVEIDGTLIPLKVGETVLGRGTTAGITVNDPGASRNHARIVWNGTKAGLEDLKSTNGTLLNGRTVTLSPLEQGDIIDIGSVRMVFRVVPGPGANL
ncbi:FHA domain-containing protein [Microbacteriaceae bacterium MWH-Ta3]|nr:FHA domain-containing protein [Microbacteriaceae bacterium MWH-Ta3]